jgi:aarF domain-containing kinase
MKGLNFATALARQGLGLRTIATNGSGVSGWTCRLCAVQARGSVKQIRGYGTRGNANGNGSYWNSQQYVKKRKRRVMLAAAGGALGVTTVAFTDDVRHAYGAVERTGRVVRTLTVCINDYRATLTRNEKEENEEENDKRLKACHQRCADRTLKVLERNGSIFIKLGQHLVSGATCDELDFG